VAKWPTARQASVTEVKIGAYVEAYLMLVYAVIRPNCCHSYL